MTEKNGHTPDTTFDASKYLTQLKGRDYLEVKFRLLWLRTEHPDAVIETEMLKADDTFAIFKARVSIPGGGSATGHGMCLERDFRDYVEKAETAAIGRALGALGYGTQFAADFEEGKLTDAPVERPQRPQRAQNGGPRTVQQPDAPATDNQKRAIRALAKQHNVDLGVYLVDAYEVASVDDLTKAQASEIISEWQAAPVGAGKEA